ncbi:MAG TPA: hypothetical protein VKU39_07510 [Streptosporangiaceae bacterium]|nr:hypothetical protein [Streptosporangiaceae bacterium]
MTAQTGTLAPDPGTADNPATVTIGLWGPAQSGKTTYLAALPIAVSDGNTRNGSWIIYPRSPGSRELMDRFEHSLVEERRFPQTTVSATPTPLEWLFVGHLSGSSFDQRLLRRFRREIESSFVLDLIDVYGRAYQRKAEETAAAAEDGADGDAAHASAALDHLAQAQGIIFLFDPVGERDNQNSAAFVGATANELRLRVAQHKANPGRYLDKHVSVCVTKFDDPDVFDQAQKRNLVTYGADGMPYVREADAKRFFDELCLGMFWAEHADAGREQAEFVRDQLRNLFRPDHIRYFVTSSIGFWMEPPAGSGTSPRFNPDDPSNSNLRDHRPGIRGKVRPINVLEPLISLQRRITGG